jgi:hypothetical protein
VAEITGEEHGRHASLAKGALHDIAAGKTRCEAFLQVVHEFTILGRCPSDS